MGLSEQLELPVHAGASPNLAPGVVVTPAWYGMKQQIRHLAQFGSGVQVVCGAKGAGKSTLLGLLNDPSEELLEASIDAAAYLEFQGLLHALLQALNIAVSDEASVGECIVQLRTYVQQLEHSQSRVVVAIDNADGLDDGSLAALVSVLQGSPNTGFGLQWLLLGGQGLAERIDQLQLLDVTVSDIQMPNFSPSELKTLLHEAHKHKRLSASVPVDQVQRLWVQSSGLPGLALALAEQVVQGKPEGRLASKRGWPLSHLAGIVILLMVLAWAFLVRAPSDTTPNKAPSPLELGQGSAVAPVRSDLAESEASVGSAGEATESASSSEGMMPESVAQPADPISSTLEATETPPDAESPKDAPLPAERVNEQTDQGEGEIAEVNGVGSNLDSDKLERDSPESVVRDAVETPSVDPIAESVPSPEVIESAEGKDVGSKASSLSELSAPLKGPVSMGERVISDEAKLMVLPANSYVLQLMAASNLEKLFAHVNAQPNRENLAIYRGLRADKQLYILVEGFYDDRSAAQMAIANLPDSQRKAKPWPKKVAQIQSEIKEVRAEMR